MTAYFQSVAILAYHALSKHWWLSLPRAYQRLIFVETSAKVAHEAGQRPTAIVAYQSQLERCSERAAYCAETVDGQLYLHFQSSSSSLNSMSSSAYVRHSTLCSLEYTVSRKSFESACGSPLIASAHLPG
jgi:hypothetical protein